MAGSADAEVTLHVLRLDGGRADVDLGPRRLPLPRRRLLVAGRSASLQVMSRDQRRRRGAARSTPRTGATSLLLAQSDPVWLDVVAGVPALLPDGRLVTTADLDGARRLVVDGEPVTDTAIQVAAVLSSVERRDGVLVAGHRRPDRAAPLARGRPVPASSG